MKTCSRCKKTKDLDSFPRNATRRDGLHCYCKSCHSSQYKSWAKDNPEKIRTSKRGTDLKRQYGLTHADYDDMVAGQDGRCAICNQECDQLRVDHCHKTNRIRGLLCSQCNCGLGNFRDSEERLLSAIEYLGRM